MADDELNSEFGTHLRSLRQKVSLSQEQLARASGISRTSIVNIERGRQGVSLGTLYRLADALGLEPQSLLPTVEAKQSVSIRLGEDTAESQLAVRAIVRRLESEDKTEW